MKTAEMYPHNPNSAEVILNDALKDSNHGWVDNQRSIVLQAMHDYSAQQLKEYREKLKEAILTEPSQTPWDIVELINLIDMIDQTDSTK